MKRATLLVVACAAMGAAFVVTSSASATYNTPKQAKKMSIEMVTAFNACPFPSPPPPLTHRPNLANPACPPAQSSANNPANVVTFGQKNGKDDGSASVTLQSAKGDIKIAAKSKSVWKNGAPYSGDDLVGTAIVRATDNGCGPPPFDVDCTQVDFPFPIALSCTNGSCKSALSANGVIPAVVHELDKMSIEIGQISILDEDGDAFASGGLFVP